MESENKVAQSCLINLTPWTVAYQAPPSLEFSRQEYWSGLPFPSPGDLPDPGIEPGSPALQVDALPSGISDKLVASVSTELLVTQLVSEGWLLVLEKILHI